MKDSDRLVDLGSRPSDRFERRWSVGGCRATDSRGFEPIAEAQVLTGKCWTVPVLANGLLYCRNAAGDVVCLDLRPQR